MLRAKTRMNCEVKEASICRRPEIVLSLSGKAKLAGRDGVLEGRFVFLPGGLSPEETDFLGSFVAHRLLECREHVELIVGEAAVSRGGAVKSSQSYLGGRIG